MSISGEYRGYVITWCDYTKLSVRLDGSECKSGFKSEEDAKKYIDNHLKKEWEPLPVYVKSYRGIGPAVITSKDSDGESVWVRDDSGRRSKVILCDILPQSDHNKQLYAELQSIAEARKKLMHKEDEAFKCFIPIQESEIKEKKVTT